MVMGDLQGDHAPLRVAEDIRPQDVEMVDHSDKVSNVLLHSEGTFQVHAPTVAAQVGYDDCVATRESIDNWVENLSRSHEAVDEEQRLTPAHLFVEDRSPREVSCDHRAPILTPSLGG